MTNQCKECIIVSMYTRIMSYKYLFNVNNVNILAKGLVSKFIKILMLVTVMLFYIPLVHMCL